jgi:hypothetical protein
MTLTKSTSRMESASLRAVKFGLIGLLGGTLAGLGFALPIYLVGGENWGADHVLRALVIGFPVGGLLGGLLIGFVFREGIGGLVSRGFEGARGHSKPEHSAIDTLVIRGAYREAVQGYGRLAVEYPTDPEPLLRGARVLRDHLGDPSGAAEWLRRARQVPGLDAQHDITITRELVELYERKLEEPGRALPELARLAERYPGTQAAEWAMATLKRIRATVWSDVKTEPEG